MVVKLKIFVTLISSKSMCFEFILACIIARSAAQTDAQPQTTDAPSLQNAQKLHYIPDNQYKTNKKLQSTVKEISQKIPASRYFLNRALV